MNEINGSVPDDFNVAVVCNDSDKCGWEGTVGECVHPKHDETLILCPMCNETVEYT